MSAAQPNQPPRGSPAYSNRYATPRHGRIPSQSNIQPLSSPQGQQPVLGHRPLPTINRNTDVPPNDLQRWAGESVSPFLRWAYAVVDNRGRPHPNHNFDPDVNNVIHISETIDAFDNDPRLMNELILRIANPDLGHPSMDWIRQNRSLVEMLLYRHYQRHGGLVLPPMAPAVQAMHDHEAAVLVARQNHVNPNEYPRVAFPNWAPPPGRSGPQSPRGKGSQSISYGSPRSAPSYPFGNVGDRFAPGGGGRGGGGSGFGGGSGGYAV